jgi:hypothetical protein
MYERETQTLRVRTKIPHPNKVRYPKQDVLLVQPDEDLVDGNPDAQYTVGDEVNVLIKATDDTEWDSTGRVVEVDTDDKPLLLGIRVNWEEATLSDLAN